MTESTNTKAVIVITGTSRGLGKSLALHYLEKGYQVFGCSRGHGTIDSPSYFHTSLDLSEEKAVRSWINKAKKKFNRLDALICNAGLVQSALYLALTPGDLMESFLKDNIAGVFYPLREASKVMAQNRRGRIIVLSSTMVPLREKGTAIYSSTKSFVTQMAKVLAKELAPSEVTCNIIAPAMMWTESSKELAKDDDWRKRMLDLQTFPRIIENEEVAHVADFFLAEKSRSITGQVVYLGLVD